MKKKIIIIVLTLSMILSSINFSFANDDNISPLMLDGGIISAPMLATVVTLGLGSGIVLKNIDDIYDIGRLFYEKNKENWNNVVMAFNSVVAFNKTLNKISVGSEFKNLVKDFFDTNFSSDSDVFVPSGSMAFTVPDSFSNLYFTVNGVKSNLYLKRKSKSSSGGYWYAVLSNGAADTTLHLVSTSDYPTFPTDGLPISYDFLPTGYDSSGKVVGKMSIYTPYLTKPLVWSATLGGSTLDIPYEGGYTWPSEWDNENNDVNVWVPSDIGSLVGGVPNDVLGDSAPSWVGNGTVTVPGIENPSIDLDDIITFPIVDNPSVDVPDVDNPSVDVPDEGIWATIRDFIINLVVPSDTFWTDTWGGLYNNFISSFPMVDMDNFNDLVTGEKKFPNIDINIMGVKGRVVNGDVVNSIVDWLRPIIAGFMMLCLMFFNYRKIYKLIRNSEPFGGIAPGTSDFSTGITEYSDNYLKAKEIIGDSLRIMTAKGGK